MASAEYKDTLHCERDALYKVITDYENYPKFVEGAQSVKVSRDGGKIVATYHVSVMKDIHYRLEHTEDAAQGIVTWKLIDSDTFKRNEGRWEVKTAGPGKCEARFTTEVEFKIPVPGFILNRIVKGSLPSMVKAFEKRAQQI